VISVPSWWKSLKITVQTQWVDDDGALLREDYKKDHNIEVPGSVREIKEKLRYEVRQEPYIESSATAENGTKSLEIGRPARILLEGGRLWRSTVVTMGHQQAEKIEVLPDMKEIIAEFKCVHPPPGIVRPPPGISGASAPPEILSVPIIVWTSEGRVRKPFPVDLRPYAQRDKDLATRDKNAAKDDIPCYLERNPPTP
jgi:hypothetical protein